MHGYYPKNSQVSLTHTDRWLVGKEKSMSNLTQSSIKISQIYALEIIANYICIMF